MRIVIVGNSAAGVSVAETIRGLDKGSNEVIVLSDEPARPYTRCLLADLVGGKKTEPALTLRPVGYFRGLNINFMPGQRVINLDHRNKQIILHNGDHLGYDRLVLTTGASPVLPDLPGVRARGVFTLRTLKDAQGVLERAKEASQAVVLGGGLVGLKAAYGLKLMGLDKVTVLVSSPRLLTRQLDEYAAALVEGEFKRQGVEIIYGTRAKGFINSTAKGLQGVELADGSVIPSGLALVAKGVKPNTTLIEQAGGQVGRGIKVDSFLRTSLENVYAAGDCIEVTDRLTGRQVNSALWTLAYEQGRYAAANILGRRRAYPNPLTRLNSARFGGVNIISVGRLNGSEIIKHYDQTNKTYRRLVMENDKLTGFVLAGNVTGAGVYTGLVKSGRPVKDYFDDLLVGHTSRIVLSQLTGY